MSNYYLDGQKPIYRNPSGDKSITLDPTNNTLTITDSTIPKTITINSQEFSNGAQTLTFVKMYEKVNGCDAVVWPAPSATQLQVENSILISDTPANQSLTLDTTGYGVPAITLLDNNTGISSVVKNNSFYINDPSVSSTATYYANQISSTSNNFSVDTGSNNFECGDVGFVINGTRMAINDTHNNIDLRTKNFTTQGDTYTFPICFSSKSSGNITYSTPSNWQQVFHYQIPFPAFAVDSTSIYNVWKVEFQMNTSNMTDQTNKECAMYFEIEDAVSAIYTGFLFNNATPFTTHRNGSTYYATSQQSENYGWTDYFDFTGINGNTPLEFRWYWFSNGTNSYDFNWLVSFTRTNLI